MDNERHALDEIKLPRIGDEVTTEWALRLCKHFGLDYLVKRIEADPDAFKPWKFDGCSCIPDELMGLFTGCKWEDITFKCCLPHDLGYAYGTPGNLSEKEKVDDKFHDDLIHKAHMRGWLAKAFKVGVEYGGAEVLGLSFSWGYANHER